jgi:hypothetical protein
MFNSGHVLSARRATPAAQLVILADNSESSARTPESRARSAHPRAERRARDRDCGDDRENYGFEPPSSETSARKRRRPRGLRNRAGRLRERAFGRRVHAKDGVFCGASACSPAGFRVEPENGVIARRICESSRRTARRARGFRASRRELRADRADYAARGRITRCAGGFRVRARGFRVARLSSAPVRTTAHRAAGSRALRSACATSPRTARRAAERRASPSRLRARDPLFASGVAIARTTRRERGSIEIATATPAAIQGTLRCGLL